MNIIEAVVFHLKLGIIESTSKAFKVELYLFGQIRFKFLDLCISDNVNCNACCSACLPKLIKHVTLGKT